jgi:predicted O-linked N-acetylglucosamine transferase (SPINDLY family)
MKLRAARSVGVKTNRARASVPPAPRPAAAQQPDSLDAWISLVVQCEAQGDRTGEAAALEQVTRRAPDHALAWARRGFLATEAGDLDAAVRLFTRAAALAPDHAEVWCALGRAHNGLGQYADAAEAFRRALTLTPNDVTALLGLGDALHAGRHLDEAITHYQRVLAVQPDRPDLYDRLAVALWRLKRSTEAVDAFRQSLALNPDQPALHSSLIFALDTIAGRESEARAERRRWNERFGQAWRSHPTCHQNNPDPERPLRVGYVSADFYQHSAATIFQPIIRAHDHARVQVFCYSGTQQRDAVNAEARALADVWHDVVDLSDDALEALIRADQIDILVDLSGHSAGNRLPVFARKPAPVQVTAWGYATGTGLDTMDYFLADPVFVAADLRTSIVEEVVDLPCVITYQPPGDIPSVAPAPVLTRKQISFGAFNRLVKASPAAVEAWARVLVAVPSSRLVIKTPKTDLDADRARLRDTLIVLGVAAERIEILGSTPQREHLEAHAAIDILLDPFPHTGGITTADALLMGVPVVTLLGEQQAGRVSASLLSALGLHDLIASNADEYVEIAVRLAGDVDRLIRERATLRQRLLASPVGNAGLYTRAVEDVYQELWRRWCASSIRRA